MVKRENFGSVSSSVPFMATSSSPNTQGKSSPKLPTTAETPKRRSAYAINTLDDNTWKLIEEKIINNPNLKWDDHALVGSVDNLGDGVRDTSKRNCKISFLDYYEELDKAFGSIVSEYNYEISNWKYDIDTLESIQLTHYSEGDFYDWHIDEFETNLIKGNGKESNRKISVTIFLNDPTEYEGGEFDLEVIGPTVNDWESRYVTLKLPKKSIVIFPSNKWHRVRPVTSGIRKSLVLWFQGTPFR